MKHRIYLLLLLLIVEIGVISSIYYFYNAKKVLKIEDNLNKKMFAMYIEKSDGNYAELLNPNQFPKNYLLNVERSICKDIDGTKINVLIEYSKGEISIETDKSVYCSLYFDKRDPDIIINVSNIQTLSGYTKSITSSDGEASWDSLYNRLIISKVTKNGAIFNLNFVKDNNSHTNLRTIVETVGSSGEGSIVNEGVAGIRYEGKNPNNYIWFNNEMWRIIGSIPVCLTSSCGNSTTKLVKIIRNESIGGLTYDAKDELNTGIWGNNTLYKLLNGCYYGQKGTKGIDYDNNNLGMLCSNYCYGYGKKAVASCNYNNIGISDSSNDYYGSMVQNVYWNTGISSLELPALEIYTNELSNQTIKGKIGLLSVSDYGYATTYGRDNLSTYNNTNYTGSDWLYKEGNEWTIISDSITSEKVSCIISKGNIDMITANANAQVRPVIYLNSSVYVISGNGTYNNPYQIGM